MNKSIKLKGHALDLAHKVHQLQQKHMERLNEITNAANSDMQALALEVRPQMNAHLSQMEEATGLNLKDHGVGQHYRLDLDYIAHGDAYLVPCDEDGDEMSEVRRAAMNQFAAGNSGRPN